MNRNGVPGRTAARMLLFLVPLLAAFGCSPDAARSTAEPDVAVETKAAVDAATAQGSASTAAAEPAAQQPPQSEPAESEPAQSEPAETEAAEDPYAVPDGSAEELIDFMARIQGMNPQVATQAEYLEHLKKLATALVVASEKVLAGEATDAQAATAVQMKFEALELLAELDDETAVERGVAFVEELADDPRPAIQQVVKKNRLTFRARQWQALAEGDQQELLRDIEQYFQQLEALDQTALHLALALGTALENQQANEAAAQMFDSLAPRFAASDDEELAAYAPKLEGVARRLRLPGNPMPLSGTRLDGTPLDWESYRGKVVLVDFWATWCGPCIAELPNVKESYERYHDRGFEVIGISLDDEKEPVQEFVETQEIPWPILFSEAETQRGWESPMAVRYGILAIPTAILVDQQGNVVSLEAVGDTLDEKLAKLLGPAETN